MSGNWGVDTNNAIEALEIFVDNYSEVDAVENLNKGMDVDELFTVYESLFRMNEYGSLKKKDIRDSVDAFVDHFGYDYVLDQLPYAMGTELLADKLNYIFRMFDFHFDDEDFDY